MPIRRTKIRRTNAADTELGRRASLEIAELLRTKRIEKNLSQSDLAKRMGYASAQYISDWERAYSSVPLSKLVELANALDIGRDHLFEMFVDFARARLDREMRDEYSKLVRKKVES